MNKEIQCVLQLYTDSRLQHGVKGVSRTFFENIQCDTHTRVIPVTPITAAKTSKLNFHEGE